ncbi:MAG: VWA domain-containing protein [Ignavibacteria bacterium]|nr:VWA domain-containing protein [Ignavibacteria bacterium]
MLRRSLLLLLILGACAATASAGRLYARRPNTPSPIYNLRLDSIRTTVTIRNLLAVTHVDEEFFNPENLELEGFYVFQLPQGATVDGLWMWVDGVRLTFAVKRKEDASKLYDSLVEHNVGDPAILQSLGSNRFQLKIFPIKPGTGRRIELEYFQTLPLDGAGNTRYVYPMNIADYQATPVTWAELHVDINSDVAIQRLTTSHDSVPSLVRTDFIDTNRVHVRLAALNLAPDRDFAVTFSPRGWTDGFPVLNYAFKDTVDDGYFLLWTPVRFAEADVPKADFVFVVDNSASMTGLRAVVVQDAMQHLLKLLQPYDRFRIVLFSHDAIAFPSDTTMLFATPENRDGGTAFLQAQFRARGVTNYEAGIRDGFRSNFRGDAERRMLFLTDGLPNEGRRTQTGLDSLLKQSGATFARFFPIALYTDNLSLLSYLADGNYGKLLAVEQGDSIDAAVQRLTFDFSATSVMNPHVTYPANTFLVYPKTLPPIANPSELVSAGRFSGSGSAEVSLLCTMVARGDSTFRHTVPFFADTSNPVQVARYWATFRINELLAQMRGVTDTLLFKELKESIVRISERYNILSPYTAFLVINEIIKPGGGTPVAENEGALAGNFVLRQNYPNPFTRSTMVEFLVPASARGQRVLLRIYDASGRLLRVLTDAEAVPGLWRVAWDGRDAHGDALAAGTYFCELRSGKTVQLIRMILVREGRTTP